MGINVEITSIDTTNSSVTFNQEGESKTMSVILPAQIKWAKIGKAEIGINPEGKINFIKSLEPKQTQAPYNGNGSYKKPDSGIRAISTVKAMEDITLTEFATVYDNINATKNTKCGASTLFRRDDGKYDAVLYVTTFVPKESVLSNESVVI